MKTKTFHAEDLAKAYDLETAQELYDYITDSLINGNRNQVKNIFNELSDASKKEFLIDYLDETNLTHKSVKNICIGELLPHA